MSREAHVRICERLGVQFPGATRRVAKGNAGEIPVPRTQSRSSRASMGLEGVHEAARRDRRLWFTALLHHITPTLLAESYYPPVPKRQQQPRCGCAPPARDPFCVSPLLLPLSVPPRNLCLGVLPLFLKNSGS